MDGGAWQDYSPRGRKESDTTERLHFHTLKFLQRRLAFEEKMSKSNQDTSCIVEQSYGFAGLVQQPAHAITRASFVCYPALPSLSCGSWPHGHIMAAALPGLTSQLQAGIRGRTTLFIQEGRLFLEVPLHLIDQNCDHSHCLLQEKGFLSGSVVKNPPALRR